jgi:hypothetical protein
MTTQHMGSRGRSQGNARSRGPGVWLTPLPKVSRMRVVTAFGRGQAAPELELPSTEGRPISLREFLGRDVVLGFYC